MLGSINLDSGVLTVPQLGPNLRIEDDISQTSDSPFTGPLDLVHFKHYMITKATAIMDARNLPSSDLFPRMYCSPFAQALADLKGVTFKMVIRETQHGHFV